jgi:hypothetical protein
MAKNPRVPSIRPGRGIVVVCSTGIPGGSSEERISGRERENDPLTA